MKHIHVTRRCPFVLLDFTASRVVTSVTWLHHLYDAPQNYTLQCNFRDHTALEIMKFKRKTSVSWSTDVRLTKILTAFYVTWTRLLHFLHTFSLIPFIHQQHWNLYRTTHRSRSWKCADVDALYVYKCYSHLLVIVCLLLPQTTNRPYCYSKFKKITFKFSHLDSLSSQQLRHVC
jgi:hypothetical protein